MRGSAVLSILATALAVTGTASCTRLDIACDGTRPTASFPNKADLQSARAWTRKINAERTAENLQCWSSENDRAASFALGMLYLNGLGDGDRVLRLNLEKAKEMFELAAKPVLEPRVVYGGAYGNAHYFTTFYDRTHCETQRYESSSQPNAYKNNWKTEYW